MPREPEPHPLEATSRLRRLTGLAWVPIPVMVATMVALWVADVRVAWPSPPLNFLVHAGSAVLAIAFIIVPAARSFLRSGHPSVLMLGCGVLMSEIGVLTLSAGVAASTSTAFAIFNVPVLASALGHFIGVVVTARYELRLRSREAWLAGVYAGGAMTTGLVIWAALAGRMPAFFVDGQGGTSLRTLVVGATVALFGLTAGLLWRTNRRTASPFSSWYALGLVLVVAGLSGSLALSLQDSPLQWTTRFTQLLGAVYMCVAVLISMREAGTDVLSLAEVAEAWRESELLAALRKETALGWAGRYGLAFGMVAIAWLLRLALAAWAGPELPAFLTFYPALMLVAMLAGFGPGLVATALADVVVVLLVFRPGGLPIASQMDRLSLAVFSCMGLVMSAVAEVSRRDRAKAAAYDREAALRDGREQLAAFAQATFEGILETEAGRVVACNEQFARMTGYAVSELLGMEIASLIPPEDRDRATAGVQQNRESFVELTARRKDGTQIVVEAHGRPGARGSARRLTVVRDLTERRLAVGALAESETKYRRLFQNMTEEVHFWKLVYDELGRIETWRLVDANLPALRTWGKTLEEIQGRTTDEIFGPGATAHYLPIVQKIMREGVPHSYEDFFANLDRYFRFTSIPLGDHFITTGADITAVKKVARLYEVLSRVNESIVRTHDEHSLFEQICRIVAELGGFPLAWIGLVDGRDIVPAASSGTANNYLDKVRIEIDGELGRGPTGTSVREDRSVINDDFDANPLTAQWRSPALHHGFRASAAFPLRRECRPVGALTIYASRPGAFDAEHVKLLESLCADVSYALDALTQERRREEVERSLRQSEQSLREVDQRKNEFLAVLSHELRNPLAPISNSLYILDRAPPGSDQATRAKQTIGRQVTQLANLVNDLLDVTRITSNKVHLQTERLELNELVRRAVEDNRSFFERAAVRLELVPAPRPVPVMADGTRIAQVVSNLLQNAAKFTPQGGRTRVTVSAEEREAVVVVRDDGVGISGENLARLFQPFMQADHTLDRSKGGLGLGLALVKGLVELHGGTVSAHSGGLGEGAEFVVRLPLDLGAALETAAVHPSAARHARG